MNVRSEVAIKRSPSQKGQGISFREARPRGDVNATTIISESITMATKAQMQVVMDELDSEIIDLKASEADWKRRYERAVDRSINPVMMESDIHKVVDVVEELELNYRQIIGRLFWKVNK
mgnify:CR=1 FL=1